MAHCSRPPERTCVTGGTSGGPRHRRSKACRRQRARSCRSRHDLATRRPAAAGGARRRRSPSTPPDRGRVEGDARVPPRSARCASVFAVGERGSGPRNRRSPTGNRQTASLRRRGLPPPPWRGRGARGVAATTGTVAAELLHLVRDEDADLIVAGGYGHSRLGEWIFGGVTHELLASSPVCCLLSH